MLLPVKSMDRDRQERKNRTKSHIGQRKGLPMWQKTGIID
jgi:hypothetical protein